MNKRGVALAADSAVTLGDGEKVYLTAEKLFPVSSCISGGMASPVPVGIMIYGGADIMGVPWETIVKLYAQKLGARTFDRLDQYAQDFLRFVESAQTLFPEPVQRRSFRQLVESYWFQFFLQPLKERLEKKLNDSKRASTIICELIEKDREDTRTNYQSIDELAEGYGDRILELYAAELNELEQKMFSSFKPAREVREGLRDTVRLMFTRNLFDGDASTVVFAGMGEGEALPALFRYRVGTLVAGKLRFVKEDEARVDHETDAVVVPMAQRQVIDMFYGGIWPELKAKLVEIARNCFWENATGKGKDSPKALREREEDFNKNLDREIQENYTASLISAVGGLPRHELAGLAEALVSITVFVAKMSTGKRETVGGPIDVALISKGDGFIWVKHKGPMAGFALS
ncbi:MAG: hypothetical protein ACREQX_08185 [Candidatus Binataceae bacterium]